MCMESRSKGEEELHDSQSQKPEIEAEHEGGDEEEGLPDTDRNLNVNGLYDRANRYRERDEDDKNLETEAGLQENAKGSKKKKKRGKSKSKKKSPNKKAKKAQSKDGPVNVKKGADKETKAKNAMKRDLRNIHELWFFSRVRRCLQPKYCNHCDDEIKDHHEDFTCDVGHVLHLECARVKWVGNKV